MDIVIYGAGGHGKVIADIIEKEGKYNILGFLDDSKETGSTFYGYKILGGRELLRMNKSITSGIVAIGDNWSRQLKVSDIVELNEEFKFITSVHPSAQIARGVEIGVGTVIMANSVVNSDTKIGNHCIVNTRSSIDHDCKIGNFSSIAPNATLAGNVSIGEYSAISMSATIIQGKSIGLNTVVGASSMVINDINDSVVAYGIPCKEIRVRNNEDKYLK